MASRPRGAGRAESTSMLWPLLVALALTALLAVVFRHANELFCVEVTEGQCRVVRGRAPQRLLGDMGDIAVRPIVVRGRIRAVVEDKAPRLLATGDFSPEQVQRLRNVLGEWTISQLRTAPRP